MILFDKDALICDFAETYNIYDFEALPADYAAVLCVGLRDNSRIKTKMAGLNTQLDIILKATICDRLAILNWQNTDRKGPKPKLMAEAIINRGKKEEKVTAYDTPEEWEKAKQEILNS